MSHKIEQAIEKIEALRAELKTLLIAEAEHLELRCNNVLLTLANGMRHFIGAPVGGDFEGGFKPTPITNVLGIDVTAPPKFNAGDVLPSNNEKQSLMAAANEAYKTFMDRDSVKLIETLGDLVIRAVAKKAGMEVSSTVPEKITVEFVNQIKKAILDKETLDSTKSKSTSAAATATKAGETVEDPAERETVINQFIQKGIEMAGEAGMEVSEENKQELRSHLAHLSIEEIKISITNTEVMHAYLKKNPVAQAANTKTQATTSTDKASDKKPPANAKAIGKK